MDQKSQNQQKLRQIKQKIIEHIQNRQKIKEMYASKNIQMLDKQQLLVQDIPDQQLNSTQSNLYESMVEELSQKGYNEFKFLGQGAQGLVVLAKNSFNNKRYAIKGVHVRNKKGIVDQVASNQVEKEIKLLNTCKGCPYVVNFLDRIEGTEFTYLVLTECLGTLNEIILRSQNKKLNELSAIKYAKDIAEGLYYIHEKECLVKDLKMDNILIDYNGNAIVSDFGYANNLTQYSGYSLDVYKGNMLCQAPECYDPNQFNYSTEYQNINVNVQTLPSSRSEACSFGYLIYTMIFGFNPNLIFNKHRTLEYSPDFQDFVYYKQLKYIIEGLTKFIPRDRLKIKEVLILLKGIICFEFSLDSKQIEVIDDEEAQQFIRQFKKEVEFVQGIENSFYPIVQNEEDFISQLNQEIEENKQNNDIQNLIILKLQQEKKGLDETINDLITQQEQLLNSQQQGVSQQQKGKKDDKNSLAQNVEGNQSVIKGTQQANNYILQQKDRNQSLFNLK